MLTKYKRLCHERIVREKSIIFSPYNVVIIIIIIIIVINFKRWTFTYTIQIYSADSRTCATHDGWQSCVCLDTGKFY